MKQKNQNTKKPKLKTKKISAIVLVGGDMDEKLYEKCLASLSWCSEIIKVYTGKISGSFAEWRNYGAKKAEGKWLLYIDSDEEVANELKNEILEVIARPNHSAYAIPRKNILLGKEMHFGGWSPDYVLRLFKKDKFINWKGKLHEQPVISGKIGKLKNKIIHRTHRSISKMLNKTNDWSQVEAKLMFEANHPKMNVARFFTAGFREFWYRAIRKMGFMDGTVGVIEIIYQTYSRLISYMKLWEMQKDYK